MRSQLICQDTLSALEKIPKDVVDIGVTSPPYNKQENKKGWLVRNVQYDGASDKKDEALYQAEQVNVLNALYRVTKPGGSFFYNHKIRWERGELLHPMSWLTRTKWAVKQEIIWDRNIAANIRGWRFWQVEERIYWLYKPIGGNKIGKELRSKHAKLTSIWTFPPERQNPHPAPFPITLPLRIIYSVMDDSKGVVIDPYCGSGTTLVAAKLLGQSYIGIDISSRYIAMTRERLRHYKKEEGFWLEEEEKHVVVDTFRDKKAQHRNVGKFSPLRRKSQLGFFS